MSLALVRPKTSRPRDIKTTILDTFSHVLPSASSSAMPATPTPPTSLAKTFHVYHTHWDYNLLIYAAAKKDWTPLTSTPIYEVSNNPYSSIGVRIKTPKSKYLSTGGGLKLPSSSSPSSTASTSSYDLTDCSPTLPPPPQIRHTFAAAKFHAFSSDIGICLGDPEIGNLASPSDVSLSAPKSGKFPPPPPPPSSPMPPRTPGGSLNSPDPLSPNSLGGIYELPGSFVGESCGTRTRKIPVFECMENVSGMVHERYRWTWEVPGDGFVEEVDNEDDMSPPTPGEQDAPIMLRIVNPDFDMDSNTVEEEHDWIHGSVSLGFQTTPGTPPRSATKPSIMMTKRSSTTCNKKTLNSPLPKPPHKRYYTWRRSEDSVWSHDWELIEDPIIDFAAEEEARKTMLARIAAEEELRKEREVHELRRLREAVAARIARAENQNRGNNININNTTTANTENGKPKVKPNRPAPLPSSVMVRPPPLPWPLPPQRSPPSYPPPPVPKVSELSLSLPRIPAGPPTPPFELPRFTAPPHIRPIISPSAQATVALGKPPGPTMGVSRDGSGNVVARWTEASWSLKKKGKLEVVKGRGEKWELMVVVTVMALVERERRRAGPG